MEESGQDVGRAVGSTRAWEAVVAGIFLAFGLLVAWDSHRLGSAWGSDGPEAGYFPFYIGVLICISAAFNLHAALKAGAEGRKAFVHWGQLKMILTVMVPSTIYVALIANPWMGLGIYVASALFIAFFMRYLGKYGWVRIAAVSAAPARPFCPSG